jgi:hypothetical protein
MGCRARVWRYHAQIILEKIIMPNLHDFSDVTAALQADKHLIWHTQARLFARISHPEALMEGESYDVDLAQPYFTGLYQGQFASGGPAQLIGTYNPADNTWLWGFHNPSVSQRGWSDLRPSLDGIEGLSSLLAQRKFEIDEDQAMKLATWIARKAGYLGAYPAPVGDTTAFLALKLSTDAAASPEPDDNRWCTLCGCRPDQVAILLSGEHGYMCDECIDKHEPLLPSEAQSNEPSEPEDAMPSCLLCDTVNTPRIMHAYTSVCCDCVRTAVGIVRQQRG